MIPIEFQDQIDRDFNCEESFFTRNLFPLDSSLEFHLHFLDDPEPFLFESDSPVSPINLSFDFSDKPDIKLEEPREEASTLEETKTSEDMDESVDLYGSLGIPRDIVTGDGRRPKEINIDDD